MTSTVTRVLGIVEMFEQILLHFDTRQLFGLMRVSHAFHSHITTSQQLRRAMFMIPTVVNDPRDIRMAVLNPLLRLSGLSLPTCDVAFYFTYIFGGTFHVMCDVRLNTLKDDNRASAARSWRKMRLASNSAPVTVSVNLSVSMSTDAKTSFSMTGNRTMGELADLIDVQPKAVELGRRIVKLSPVPKPTQTGVGRVNEDSIANWEKAWPALGETRSGGIVGQLRSSPR